MLSSAESRNLWFTHVNRNRIASNRKHNEVEPVVRFQKGVHGAPTYATRVRLHGTSEVLYDPEGLLPCGAQLVISSTEQPEVLA
jgi:hypothetical protein